MTGCWMKEDAVHDPGTRAPGPYDGRCSHIHDRGRATRRAYDVDAYGWPAGSRSPPSPGKGMMVPQRCPESNCQACVPPPLGKVSCLKISSRLAGAIKLPFRKLNSI